MKQCHAEKDKSEYNKLDTYRTNRRGFASGSKQANRSKQNHSEKEESF
jgi:hypothetical protein